MAEYGTVFRIYPSRVIQPTSDREPGGSNQAAETVALEWTSELLSRRFGYRSRPYPAHESKVVNTPIFRELAAMYAEALADSGRARVRSQTGSKVMNVHIMALYLHFVVERSREAALWSWAVGRMTQIARRGDMDWLDAAWAEMGGAPKGTTTEVKAEVARNDRPEARDQPAWSGDRRLRVQHISLLELRRVSVRRARHEGLRALARDAKGRQGRYGPPALQMQARPQALLPHARRPRCRLHSGRLLPAHRIRGLRVWRLQYVCHVPVRYCLTDGFATVLTHLVAKSGTLGLSAVLPDPPEDPSTVTTTFEQAPHLPIVPDFSYADFSVDAVVPHGGDLRAFSVQLIHRYRYILGRITSGFAMLNRPEQATKEFARLDKEINKGWMGTVCVNDDIVQEAAQVDVLFREWQEEHWPTPAAWEADLVQ